MQCTNPITLKTASNPLGIKVPCGKCTACKIAHAREWSIRLMQESILHENNAFLTLTYNNEHLPVDNSLDKRTLQLFFKRLRKRLLGTRIKYYACGEYGDKFGRPHYHAVVLGLPKDYSGAIKASWNLGFVKIGTVTYDSCRYVAQYVDKKYNGDLAKQVYGLRQIPFQLQSQGIGKQFCLSHAEQLKENLGCTINGVPVGLPRYYRKILDIDKMALFDKSADAIFKTYQSYRQKGVTDVRDINYEIIQAHKQHEKTLRSRLDLKEKKL